MLDHPLALELLKAITQGDAKARDLAKVAIHQVIAEDPGYQQVLEDWTRQRRDRPAPTCQVASAVVRALDQLPTVERRKRRARQWLVLFRSLPSSERRQRVERLARRLDAVTLALCLIEACKVEVQGSPREAYELASAAVRLLDRSSAQGNEPLRSTLLAQALAWTANTQRALGNLIAADRLLTEARGVEDAVGALDPSAQAELAHIEGSLRRAQCRFPEAEALFEEALGLYDLLGDRPSQREVLISHAKAFCAQGHVEKALEATYELLADMRPQDDLRLYLGARFNLAHFLHSAGHHQEALDRLTYDEILFASSPDALLRRCVRWLEGKIWAGLGDDAQAEELFLNVKKDLTHGENGFDVALVSLDLALLYLSQGRTAEVKALAAEAVALFEAQAVHREALAALVLFQQAADAEQLGAELVARLGRFLEAAKRNPGVRWEEVR